MSTDDLAVIHRAIVHADEVERGIAQDCNDGPCEECDEPTCSCRCHYAHEFLPEEEYEGN